MSFLLLNLESVQTATHTNRGAFLFLADKRPHRLLSNWAA